MHDVADVQDTEASEALLLNEPTHALLLPRGSNGPGAGDGCCLALASSTDPEASRLARDV